MEQSSRAVEGPLDATVGRGLRRAPFFHTTPPLAPVDRVARRVTSEGEHWEPTLTRNARGAPKTMDTPPAEYDALPWNYPDITGVRRGRMTAVRHYKRASSGKGLWLVQCDCGAYEFRRWQKWLNHFAAMDACARCDEAHFVRTGSYLVTKAGEHFSSVAQQETPNASLRRGQRLHGGDEDR